MYGWMAVTYWTRIDTIDTSMSQRLRNARFTVLLDEDFLLQDQSLPVQTAQRQIERVTERLHARWPNRPANVRNVRGAAGLPVEISRIYQSGGYLHIYIEP